MAANSSVFYTKSFCKDLERLKKQGKDLTLLFRVICIICAGNNLPAKYYNHKLKGSYNGYSKCYDCHIVNDWVLIYRFSKEDRETVLQCIRTGSHSELF